jgi:hypothetical protein
MSAFFSRSTEVKIAWAAATSMTVLEPILKDGRTGLDGPRKIVDWGEKRREDATQDRNKRTHQKENHELTAWLQSNQVIRLIIWLPWFDLIWFWFELGLIWFDYYFD